MPTTADETVVNPFEHPVELVGQSAGSLETLLEEERIPIVERTIAYECLSGERRRSTWTGLALEDLLETVDVPPDTTHLLVESADDHRACIQILSALDGLLAITRDGDQLDEPRFVAPGIVGPRAVTGVRRVDCVGLSPDEERTAYETFSTR